MIEDTPVKMWASVCDVKAWREISNLCSLPFLFHHLALMPDVHGGVGMPIGAVLATKNVANASPWVWSITKKLRMKHLCRKSSTSSRQPW